MASEIEQLPDLAGYLKLASRPQWMQVALARPTPARVVAHQPPRVPAAPQRALEPARPVHSEREDLGME
jgi:hypothetical protein